MKKPRILFFDIETSPLLAYVWSKYQDGVTDIKEEWEILCFAYKWAGQKRIHYVGQNQYKNKGDKQVCKKLWKLFKEADLIVAHNLKGFDLKKAKARFIYHGLKPCAPNSIVDTLQEAKDNFKFTSNKLGDLGQFLRLGKKAETGGFELWKNCLAGKRSAWATMRKYNMQDVALLEKVYDKLKPWMSKHPNLSLLDGRRDCHVCGSVKVERNGYRVTAQTRYIRYRCRDCGACYQKASTRNIPGYGVNK